MEHRGGIEGPDIWCRISLACVLSGLPSSPLQPFRSFLRRANADMRGLSCMLLPFFPRRPHLLGTASSCSPALMMPCPVRSRRWTAGVLFEELPSIAATEECAQRACYWVDCDCNGPWIQVHNCLLKCGRDVVVAICARHGAEGFGVWKCMRQECGARQGVFKVEGTWTAICLVQST